MLRRNIKFIYNVTTTSTYREFLPRDAMHSADYAVAKCLSVRLTVTRRYYIETAKHVTKLFSAPHHPSFSLPTGMAILRRGPEHGGAECTGYGKIAIFGQYVTLSRK